MRVLLRFLPDASGAVDGDQQLDADGLVEPYFQGALPMSHYRGSEESDVPDIDEPTGDHLPFICDVVHVHRRRRLALGEPILFLGYRDFATLGERWRFRLPTKT